ncbi:MAG: hypothetical protein Q9O24_00985 [Gammaproteobacteria bacterium]|nr:hypothetical protein [Gammaproteobacteria bacterium]
MKLFTLITLLSIMLLSSGCHRLLKPHHGYGHGHGHHTQSHPQSQSYGHRTTRH